MPQGKRLRSAPPAPSHFAPSHPRFWKEGEPNNSGNNEDCAHVWVSGKWNDVYCTYECYYVCEKPLPN